MPYFDENNEEYWEIKEILRAKGESVSVAHITNLAQKLFRMKIPVIYGNSGNRLYKKSELFLKMKDLEAQIDIKEHPLKEIEEIAETDLEITSDKTENMMNVAYFRVPNKTCKKELIEQQKLVMEYCISNGIKIDHQYIDVCSSCVFDKNSRNGLDELVNDILDGRILRIYILSPDILSPFFHDFFVNLCNKCGVSVDVITKIPSKHAKKHILNEIIEMSEKMKKRFLI